VGLPRCHPPRPAAGTLPGGGALAWAAAADLGPSDVAVAALLHAARAGTARATGMPGTRSSQSERTDRC